MKINWLFVWGALCAFTTTLKAQSQWVTLLADSFHQQRPVYFDLSEKLLWANQATPNSAFMFDTLVTDRQGLRFFAVGLKRLAIQHAGYTRTDGLKTSIALDYPFPMPIMHELDTIEISYHLLWDTLLGGGESGRVVTGLMHAYPQGGPMFNDVDSVNKPHAFARPAYNMRIMNKNATLNNNLNAVLLYGGGHKSLGEVEIFRQGNNSWWLPGFSTEAGGLTPGSTPPYPSGGCAQLRNSPIASTQRWRRFTWTIYPERMTCKVGNTSDSPDNDFQFFNMLTPQVDTLNPAPTVAAFNSFYGTNLSQLPRLYYWFPKFEAFRFFWNAGFNVWLSALTIKTTGNTPVITGNEAVEPTKNVVLFPNPGTTELRIAGLKPPIMVSVIDATGRVVYSSSAVDSDLKIATQNWASGIYQICVNGKNEGRWHKY